MMGINGFIKSVFLIAFLVVSSSLSFADDYVLNVSSKEVFQVKKCSPQKDFGNYLFTIRSDGTWGVNPPSSFIYTSISDAGSYTQSANGRKLFLNFSQDFEKKLRTVMSVRINTACNSGLSDGYVLSLSGPLQYQIKFNKKKTAYTVMFKTKFSASGFFYGLKKSGTYKLAGK